MKLKSAIIAAAVGSAILAAPASARTDTTLRVSYADLDLTTATGQAELQARLDKAARKACASSNGGSLNTVKDRGTCYREARKDVAVRMASLIAEFQRGG